MMGRAVERPIKPISIEFSQNEAELRDPKAYPVKVRHSGVWVHDVPRSRWIHSKSGAFETNERFR